LGCLPTVLIIIAVGISISMGTLLFGGILHSIIKGDNEENKAEKVVEDQLASSGCVLGRRHC